MKTGHRFFLLIIIIIINLIWLRLTVIYGLYRCAITYAWFQESTRRAVVTRPGRATRCFSRARKYKKKNHNYHSHSRDFEKVHCPSASTKRYVVTVVIESTLFGVGWSPVNVQSDDDEYCISRITILLTGWKKKTYWNKYSFLGPLCL